MDPPRKRDVVNETAFYITNSIYSTTQRMVATTQPKSSPMKSLPSLRIGIALVAGILVLGATAYGQSLQLRYTFEDSGTTTTNDSTAALGPVVLNMVVQLRQPPRTSTEPPAPVSRARARRLTFPRIRWPETSTAPTP